MNGIVGACHWVTLCETLALRPPPSVLKRLIGLLAAWGRTHTLKGHRSWTLVFRLFIQCRLAVSGPVGGDSDTDPTFCSGNLVKSWLLGFMSQVGKWGRVGCLLGLELSLTSR